MGRESPSKKDGDGGDTGGGPTDGEGGGATGADVIRSRRRAKAVFEHKPQELHLAVNGYVLGSQKVHSRLNEQTLDVNLSEPINFVEVFSEQKLRLLFSCVDAPPEGPHRLAENVELSDGRRLALTLRFRTPWPSLHVAYTDPTFDEVQSLMSKVEGQEFDGDLLAADRHRLTIEAERHPLKVGRMWAKLRRPWQNFGPSTSDLGLLLRPGAITAIVASILVAAFLFVNRSTAPLSAANILAQSVAAEETQLGRVDQIVHRTINLEERNAKGELVTRRRIESWHSAERGVTARRIYDEENRLVAGDWRRADGIQTLYHHRSRPQLQIRNPQSAIRNFENAWWQQDLTAQDFSAFVQNAAALSIYESTGSYVLTYQIAHAEGLKQATLRLSRPDLHAMEQTFVVRQGNEERTYHFLETSFERRPPTAVAPAVFEPDSVLVGKDAAIRKPGEAEPLSPGLSLPATPTLASAELEVEVVRLLDRVGAFGGEQLSLERTSEGTLHVEGVLDTEQRKRELLNALRPVFRNPAIRIRIETQEEAAARLIKQKAGSPPGQIELNEVQVTNKVPPAYAELRNYFAQRSVSSDQTEKEINAYVESVLGHSARARQQARALQQIAGRFSLEELRMLDDDSRAKWRNMILQRARSFQREAEGLRRKLEPLFSGSAAGEQFGDIKNDSELVQAISRLFSFWTMVDENVRQTFSIASSGQPGIAVKQPQFWRSLKSAEALATRIQNVH